MRFISEELFGIYFSNLIKDILFYKALIEKYNRLRCADNAKKMSTSMIES